MKSNIIFNDDQFIPILTFRNIIPEFNKTSEKELEKVAQFLRSELKSQRRVRYFWWWFFAIGLIATLFALASEFFYALKIFWYVTLFLIAVLLVRDGSIDFKVLFKFQEPKKAQLEKISSDAGVLALIDVVYQFVRDKNDIAIASGLDEHVVIILKNPIRKPFGKLLILGNESDKNRLNLSPKLMNFELLFEKLQEQRNLSEAHIDFLKQLDRQSIQITSSKDLIFKLSLKQIIRVKDLTEELWGHVGVTKAFHVIIDRKKNKNVKYAGGRKVDTESGKFELMLEDFYGKTINGKNKTFEKKINWLKNN